MHSLELTGVTQSYGRERVLRGVDLLLDAGEGLALLGPNGTGKTTLLKVAAGLLRPDAGDVRIHGVDLARARDRAISSLGFLSHEPYVYELLTPFENLVFFARLHGLAAPRQKAARALERVALDVGRWTTPFRALSRGLKQRVALARALVHEPRLLVLDEPFSGLDPDAAGVLTRALREHRNAGGSLLVTTHDLDRVSGLADSVVVLARGRIAWSGRVDSLASGELEREYRLAVGSADG